MESNTKVRIKFSKHGPTKYIGHLDMLRYFQKSMRRAEIDIAYSTGFSPHQIMSFAYPLGVGMETDGDYFDIEMYSVPDTTQVKDALNAVMVPGIVIENVIILPQNCGNAMASVAAASYTITKLNGSDFEKELIDGCQRLFDSKEILVEKVTKKNTLTVDIRPNIYELSMDSKVLRCKVDASSAGNVKPITVLQALAESVGVDINEYELQITRLETYHYIGEGAKKHLAPMDCFD